MTARQAGRPADRPTTLIEDQETRTMAQLAQPRTTVSSPVIGLALAVSLLGGIVGGAVAITVPAVIQARADQDIAQAAERAKWLKYGEDWERRYRQMYPIIEPS
jgi:hypothetical protein